jgi:hypothetical protein
MPKDILQVGPLQRGWLTQYFDQQGNFGGLCVTTGCPNVRPREQPSGVRHEALQVTTDHQALLAAHPMLIIGTTTATQGHLLGPTKPVTFTDQVYCYGFAVQGLH